MARRAPLHRPRWLRREERREERSAVSVPAGVYGRHTERAVVRLVDLSPTGCRVLGARPGATGAFLTVEIAGMLSIEAWVAWTRAGEIGLDFVHPVPAPLVDHIVAIGSRLT